jgi:CDP-glycerol glycerophosphotransferase (TagB/SpsB family)
MNKLKEFLLYFLNIPLFWISTVIPKRNNIWIFGAWFGHRYADNSKHLFEYVNQNLPEIRVVWISRNRDVVEMLNEAGFESFLFPSVKGIFYILTAKVAIFSTGKEDISQSLISPNHFKVYLGHGIALKKIVYDDKITYDLEKPLTKLKFLCFPFLKPSFDMVIATSKETRRQLSGAFRLPIELVPITGYPRNDLFFDKELSFDESGKQILYAPTHRQEGKGMHIKEILPEFSKLAVLNESLKKSNTQLFFRLHYYDQQYLPPLTEFSHISFAIKEDIQEILCEMDILITDYSSF